MSELRARFGAVLSLLLAFGQLATMAAGSPKSEVLSKYFVKGDQATIHQVASRFEIILRRNGGFEVLVPARRAAELVAIVPSAVLEEADISARFHRYGWDAQYHDFDSVQSDLNGIVQAHPNLAKLETYGKSEEGRPLFALTVTGTKATSTSKPEIMITAATHGNELITVEVLFAEVHALVDNYGKPGQQRMTDLLDGHVFHFIPVVNPDGYVQQSRYANGLDPNRDYPYPDDPNHQSNAAIQNEIAYFSHHDIKASIDYHAYGRLIMYPWAYTDAEMPAADVQTFNTITSEMASLNGYTNGQISHILYVAEGSSADYYYWKNHTIALGIEIGDAFVPDPSEIAGNIQDNLEPAWRFVEHFNPSLGSLGFRQSARRFWPGSSAQAKKPEIYPSVNRRFSDVFTIGTRGAWRTKSPGQKRSPSA